MLSGFSYDEYKNFALQIESIAGSNMAQGLELSAYHKE